MSLSIAVVGASPDRRKFGNKCVRAYLASGYDVYPVHPSEPIVEGLTAYPTIADVPVDRFDRVSVYLPPPVALKVLSSFTAKPIGEVWFNPGADTPEVLHAAKALGLTVVAACSIVDIGRSPREFPDE